MPVIILPLSSPEAILENAGGKGASLARLARLGMPVPPGFIITTQAYRRFVAANDLEQAISASLDGSDTADLEQLERASAEIRAAFGHGKLPEDIGQAIHIAYSQLDAQKDGVAVRSSATTEDLPELSFAGQQDTFLNVRGEDPLKKAVIDCWSSLWTARAISYRTHNAIVHEQVAEPLALAVVVQRMVVSEISGVLFTANPLTGLRSEMVADATFGLGEALVSGQVEPDHFVLDALNGEIRNAALGSKTISTQARAGGGVENNPEDRAGQQTLDGEKARRLAAAGRQIQEAYGSPQDIEWAFSGNELYILQSRPITSLFPVPRISFDPLIVWFSFGAFQGLLGPLTPLGQEAIQRVVLGVGKKLGYTIDYEQQGLFAVAGERIWIKISDLMRNPLGNRVLGGFMGIGEPGTARIMKEIASDPRLTPEKSRPKLSTIRRLLRFLRPGLKELPRAIFQPEKTRERFDAELEAFLRTVRIPGGKDRFERLANFAAFMSAQGGLADALPVLLPRFMPIMAPSLAMLKIIDRLLSHAGQDRQDNSVSAMDVTRGLPRNITIEMDLLLWHVATLIKADPAAAEAFHNKDAAHLAGEYLEGTLPAAAQGSLNDFMEKYGMRCAGEIDLGQPRWREDPTQVIQTLQSYLQVADENSPVVLYERNVRAAGQAIERMAGMVRRTPAGWLKEKILRAAARRVRLLLGARESPKFYAVRAMFIVRNRLLEIGEEFAAAGTILRREDLFYLHVNELDALAHGEEQDWKELVAGRRQAYERELRRKQVPRVLVSDGRVFYEGLGADSDTASTISGSPVSPGIVEGRVRVVFDPRSVRLAPGEILVCRGTDPAWTPLFMAAGGLVMEVGGMMTHGSVVAREYGIPAVVGVHQATTRLKDGQLIRLDGNSGKIVVLS